MKGVSLQETLDGAETPGLPNVVAACVWQGQGETAF